MRNQPLFQVDRVWVIDTSSILWIKDRVPRVERPQIFDELSAMVQAERLVYPKQVLKELDWGVPDEFSEWAKRNETRASRHSVDFDAVRQVLATVPRVLDVNKVPASGKDEADPYVIALAMQLHSDGTRVTVITDDRRDRPDKMSMASACGVLEIVSLPMLVFLEVQGIWQPSE